jgi:hypothetical protein
MGNHKSQIANHKTGLMLLFLLLGFTLSIYSMQPCRCNCGTRTMDFFDYVKTAGIIAGAFSAPVYLNYMMYKDGNMPLLYVYDGLLTSSFTVVLLAEDEKIKEYAMYTFGALFIGAELGYSIYSIISGGDIDTGGKSTRGEIGLIAIPLAWIAAFLISLDCRCRPEKDCLAFSPAIGPDYAGLNCNFKF